MPSLIVALSGIYDRESLNPSNAVFIDNDGDVRAFTPSGCPVMSAEVENFTTNLVDSLWEVDEFILQGNDGTSNFNNEKFDFEPNGMVTLVRGGQQRNRLWNASEDESGIGLTLRFNPSSVLLDALSQEWKLMTADADTMKFENLNDPLGFDYLVMAM